MVITPIPLSSATLDKEVLREDKKQAKKYESCKLGKKAMYLKHCGVSAFGYIPLNHVERVFKRLAVSKGFYKGGVFGTLPYFVVHYENGTEKQIRFKYEENVNELVKDIKAHTSIPVGKP